MAAVTVEAVAQPVRPIVAAAVAAITSICQVVLAAAALSSCGI
jgi:hypothetical protein